MTREARVAQAAYTAVKMLHSVRCRRIHFDDAKNVVTISAAGLTTYEIIEYIRETNLGSDNPSWTADVIYCQDWDAFEFFGVL